MEAGSIRQETPHSKQIRWEHDQSKAGSDFYSTVLREVDLGNRTVLINDPRNLPRRDCENQTQMSSGEESPQSESSESFLLIRGRCQHVFVCALVRRVIAMRRGRTREQP